LAEIRESTAVGERRRARECALQLLYQLDLSPEAVETAIELFWVGKRSRPQVREFTLDLVRGAMERREWIDGVLASISHHWRVSRMAAVDRNILRLALYEMVFLRSTPPIVVINEAIEIAKRFGNDDSGPFINGILDALRLRLERGELSPPADAEAPRPSRVRNSA
jgi:N utilization substance protein B